MALEAPEITQTYPAEPPSVPLARRRIADYAERAGADHECVETIRLASSEALTNAVLHAYRGGDGQIQVTVATADEDLWVLVGDAGFGMQARADRPGLGLGLTLIAQLSDEMCIEARSGGGTEVRMRFALARQAGRGSRQGLTPSRAAA